MPIDNWLNSWQPVAKAKEAIETNDIPNGAILSGAAGLLPYLGTAASTVYLSRQAGMLQNSGASTLFYFSSDPASLTSYIELSAAGGDTSLDAETALALLHHVESVQVAYGAVVLAFIGAVHWGFDFAGYPKVIGRDRLLLGLTPITLAIPTLLLPGQIALAAQLGAFSIAGFLDHRATTRGWSKCPVWQLYYSAELVDSTCMVL